MFDGLPQRQLTSCVTTHCFHNAINGFTFTESDTGSSHVPVWVQCWSEACATAALHPGAPTLSTLQVCNPVKGRPKQPSKLPFKKKPRITLEGWFGCIWCAATVLPPAEPADKLLLLCQPEHQCFDQPCQPAVCYNRQRSVSTALVSLLCHHLADELQASSICLSSCSAVFNPPIDLQCSIIQLIC
jgi:hypothetical protein